MEAKIEAKTFNFCIKDGILEIHVEGRRFEGVARFKAIDASKLIDGSKLALNQSLILGMVKNLDITDGFVKFQVRRNRSGVFLVLSVFLDGLRKPKYFLCLPKGKMGEGWRKVALYLGLLRNSIRSVDYSSTTKVNNAKILYTIDEDIEGCNEIKNRTVLVLCDVVGIDWEDLRTKVGVLLNKKMDGYITVIAKHLAIFQVGFIEEVKKLCDLGFLDSKGIRFWFKSWSPDVGTYKSEWGDIDKRVVEVSGVPLQHWNDQVMKKLIGSNGILEYFEPGGEKGSNIVAVNAVVDCCDLTRMPCCCILRVVGVDFPVRFKLVEGGEAVTVSSNSLNLQSNVVAISEDRVPL